MNFSKSQATGNDFILVDARTLERDWSKLANEICHRYFGAGADGLIIVGNSDVADLKMRLFNSDGSEAEVSGNGLRCFAKYAIDRHIVSSPELTVDTLSGIRTVEASVSHGSVIRASVNMGKPRFGADDIPVILDQPKKGQDEVDIKNILDYKLRIGGTALKVSLVSMGNPHAVNFLSEPVADFPLCEIGPEVENHRIFPERINFEVARVLERDKIEARVWERGAGETLSCGSGACAIAVIARVKGYTNDQVNVILEGGELGVKWDGVGDVYLSGPVEEVFHGEWTR